MNQNKESARKQLTCNAQIIADVPKTQHIQLCGSQTHGYIQSWTRIFNTSDLMSSVSCYRPQYIESR